MIIEQEKTQTIQESIMEDRAIILAAKELFKIFKPDNPSEQAMLLANFVFRLKHGTTKEEYFEELETAMESGDFTDLAVTLQEGLQKNYEGIDDASEREEMLRGTENTLTALDTRKKINKKNPLINIGSPDRENNPPWVNAIILEELSIDEAIQVASV